MIGRENKALPRTIYACASTYFVLCGIWVLPLGLSIVAALRGADFSTGVAVSAAILLAAGTWVRSFKIELSTEGIDYRAPFFQHAYVRWSEITAVESAPRWRAAGSPFQMVVTTHPGAEPIAINIKVFSNADLSALANLIQAWSPEARMDEATLRLVGYEVPSIFTQPR